MIDISVNLEERGLRGFVRSLQWTLQGPAASEVVGEACADLTRGHLRGLASRRHRPGLPHSFYGRAADAVVSETVTGGAVITVPHEGLALRYYGGTVRPSGRVSLVTGRPITRLAVPITGKGAEGKTPGDYKDLFVIVSRRSGKAVLAGRKPGGKVGILFALVKSTRHTADKGVMPADADYERAASDALDELLTETFNG